MGIFKKKSQHFVIPLHVYPFEIIFSMNESDEVLFKKLEKHGHFTEEDLENIKLRGAGRCIAMSGLNLAIIRIEAFPQKYYTAGTISHEVLHAVIYILNACGLKLERGVSDEAFTYLMGYITSEIYKKINI